MIGTSTVFREMLDIPTPPSDKKANDPMDDKAHQSIQPIALDATSNSVSFFLDLVGSARPFIPQSNFETSLELLELCDRLECLTYSECIIERLATLGEYHKSDVMQLASNRQDTYLAQRVLPHFKLDDFLSRGPSSEWSRIKPSPNLTLLDSLAPNFREALLRCLVTVLLRGPIDGERKLDVKAWECRT